jgi:hypothetical protein
MCFCVGRVLGMRGGRGGGIGFVEFREGRKMGDDGLGAVES